MQIILDYRLLLNVVPNHLHKEYIPSEDPW